jgi:Beta-ketoacyl synthase, N-terminal domain
VVGVRFKVTDWRAWAPGFETLQAWQDWAGSEGATPEIPWSSSRLPPLMQRRIGSLGQKVVSAALGCEAVATGRYILASRHGELGRTVGLLRSLATAEALSPTDFSMSVHHALAGLLSIHTGNRQGHTAVAAGADTFGFGFLEAASYVAAESKPALLIFCDAPLPMEYEAFETPDDALPLVVVVQLEPVSDAEPHTIFSLMPSDRPARPDGVPTAQAPRDFLRFLLGEDPAVLSAGQRMDWRWQRVH